MLTYRGDKFVKGKKFTINENIYRFSKRDEEKLIFESVSDGSKFVMTEDEFNEAERILTEKINQENKDINEIIGKVLRSKGLARKYEDVLKSKGITINYDNPQGVTLTGANGRVLGASSKEVYGPHTPDSSTDRYDKNGYRRNADGHYQTDERPDTYYSEQLQKYKEELEKLKTMDRDDIIRAYADKTTDEALKAHEEKINRYEDYVKKYSEDAARADERYKSYVKGAKRNRREAQYDRLRTTTPKETADSSIDYLNYLTKPKNDYMDNIRGYYKGYDSEKSRSKQNPGNNWENKGKENDIDKYKSLKQAVNSAKSDVESRTAGDNSVFRYSSAAMTDEQLEAKIQSMRDELEQKIEELRKSNKANSESRDQYIKKLQDREKELDDFLKSKGIREAVLNFVNKPILSESADESKFEYLNSEITKEIDNLIHLAMEAEECGYEALKRAYEDAADILENYSHYSDSIYQKEDGTYGRIMTAQEAKDSGIYDVIEKYKKTHKE